MKIRVEHAAFREAFDHAQLLNPEQHQRGPDVIEKLNCNEQNPQRDSVSFCSARESNAVMSNKHFQLLVEAFCRGERLSCRLTQAPLQRSRNFKSAARTK